MSLRQLTSAATKKLVRVVCSAIVDVAGEARGCRSASDRLFKLGCSSGLNMTCESAGQPIVKESWARARNIADQGKFADHLTKIMFGQRFELCTSSITRES